MSKVVNITVAGLGGQGVLKVTDILADTLFAAGYQVKKSEVHGMSQRGGSVASEVRFGEKVNSPMIPEGESDYLVVIDPTQVEVAAGKLKSGGVLITPDWIDTALLGNPKAINIALLGALAPFLPLDSEALWQTATGQLPEKVHAVNREAFLLGLAAGKEKQ